MRIQKKYFVVLLGLPNVWFVAGSSIVGQQTKPRLPLDATWLLECFFKLFIFCSFRLYLSPSYLSITVCDYWNSSVTFFSYNKRLVKAFLMGCLKHSTLWFSLPVWKKSVSVYQHLIWQMWCSLSPSDTNPLSTICIKWLASKLCCAVSSECLCLYHYLLHEMDKKSIFLSCADCMKQGPPPTGSAKTY